LSSKITKLKQRVKKLERMNKLKVLKLRRLKRVRSAQRIDTSDGTVIDDVSKQGGLIENINADDDVVLEDAKDVAVKNTTITAADVPIPAATTATITSTLTAAPSKRTKGVVIRDPEESTTTSTIIHSESKSKDKELNKTIDWDEVIDHVQRKQKEDKSVKRYQALKKKPQTEAQARKNMMVYLKNVAGFKMDYFKGMTYDDILLIFEKHFDSNVAFLQKTKEQMNEQDNKALKRLNESKDEKAAKKQKLDEEVPIVDYEIYNENNKPYFKIKRADDIHQLYISFLSMLRNFDRGDLEVLWQLVKERFATTKPKNFSDDFLLITLGAMFEKSDIHAQIWKIKKVFMFKQKSRVGSCWNPVMLSNVILKVEEESEVSLELLSYGVDATMDFKGKHAKCTTASSSNIQNVAFVSAENTSSTNDVSTAYSVSSPSVSKSQKEASSSYTDEVIHSFFANQSSDPQLDYDDLERPAYQDDSKALVTIDGEDIDWSGYVEEDTQNYVMMAYSSSNSGSDNQIRFMKIDLDDKSDVLAYHKKLLAEALKEKEDLKTKFENWQNSSKNLSKLLNTKMSANDKFRLGYGDYRYCSILNYENEVLQSMVINKAGDLEDTPVNDRYADGMHAVPPPMTGNYMPSGPDVKIDYSKFTYGPNQTSADESDSKPSEYASCESDSGIETSTSMLEPVENASKVVCEPKVWTDAPIIEEYESDSDNDSVSNVQKDKEKPSFSFTDPVKHVKTSRKNIKETGTTNHCPKIEKHDRNGHTRKGLGYAFTRKACFVCGSFSHLIRDYDFYEKRMAKQAGLTKSKKKKEKQHKASCKAKTMSFVNQPLHNLHMDLFGPISVRSINHKTYCLVITDGFSRFSWVYFLKSKDETTPILKDFIRQAKNQFNHIVKTIRSDNRTAFNNKELIEFRGLKRIKREYSTARTPQQNRVVERKNMTFIEATRTMLADSFLPITFWAEAFNTACYVLNRVLVTKPQNKTPYELLTGKKPIISYLRPFGFHVTILNTIDQLGKFDGKSDSGFLVGYSLNSKAFREKEANDAVKSLRNEATHDIKNANTSSTNLINTASTPLSTAGPSRAFNDGELSYPDPSKYALLDDPSMPHLEDIYASLSEGIFTDSSYDDEGVVTDFNNLETTVNVSPSPTARIHTIYPKTQILRDPMSAVQIRRKVNKNSKAHALVNYIQKQQRNN
nr:putative ribonuclease H-like domain-containing protein [Tanacetum cinerariifolium]